MIFVLVVLVTSAAAASSYTDRRDYSIDDQHYYPRQITHTFPNRTQCFELCELPCSLTHVYMGTQLLEMYNCAKLRPPKVSMLGSIKGNSFYMTLVVIGFIALGVIGMLTLCFCCSYCCTRSPGSSRGSSKEGLTANDGEFREVYEPESLLSRKDRGEYAKRSGRITQAQQV